MTHLYYFAAILIIWNEMSWIVSPKEKTAHQKAYKELQLLNKGKKWDQFSQEYKTELKSKIWLLPLTLWLFLGLFTFQWDAFLMILVFNIFVVGPISKLTQYSIVYTALHWLNSVIGFAFGVFVIVNHYHLQISLWAVLKDWLSP